MPAPCCSAHTEPHCVRRARADRVRVFRTGEATQRCNPAPRRARANSTTFGVMPGISAMTITAGPVPARNTSRVLPSKVNCVLSNPSSTSSFIGRGTYFDVTRTICGRERTVSDANVVRGARTRGRVRSVHVVRHEAVRIRVDRLLLAVPPLAALRRAGAARARSGCCERRRRPRAASAVRTRSRMQGARRYATGSPNRTTNRRRSATCRSSSCSSVRRADEGDVVALAKHAVDAHRRRLAEYEADRRQPRHRGAPTQDPRDGPAIRTHGDRILGGGRATRRAWRQRFPAR